MKVKTDELTGAALDWAVAKCEGELAHVQFSPLASSKHYFAPSKKWAQGGPIIERERICVSPFHGNNEWSALDSKDRRYGAKGATALVAAMRCYVASKLGDEIDVPEELA